MSTLGPPGTELGSVSGSVAEGKPRARLCCLRLGCASWGQIIGVTGRWWGAVGRILPAVLMLTESGHAAHWAPEFVWV